jgi:hypothetical protein
MKQLRATIVLFSGLVAIAAAQAEERDAGAELAAWRVDETAELAARAEAKGDVALARRILFFARDLEHAPFRDALARLAEVDDAPKLTERRRDSLGRPFEKYRRKAAKRIGKLAKELADGDDTRDRARQLARVAIEHDRDEETARFTLGQVRAKGWGWVPVAHAAELARGRAEFDGRWLPVAAVDRKRQTWKHAWRLETDHWSVRSNLPLERVREIARRLEALWEQWRADWAGSLPLRERPGRHEVFVFARESEYRTFLERTDPNHVRGVPGQYSSTKRLATLWDVETLRATGQRTSSLLELLQHECTHQLFREAVRARDGNVESSDAANFWVHEGIAEFYGMHLGDRSDDLVLDRKHVAPMLRTKHLKGHLRSFPGFATLDEMRKRGFQASERDRRLTHYAGSGFLFAYLWEGPHRSALRRIVRDVYAGRNAPGALGRALGERRDDVDRAFRRWVRSY